MSWYEIGVYTFIVVNYFGKKNTTSYYLIYIIRKTPETRKNRNFRRHLWPDTQRSYRACQRSVSTAKNRQNTFYSLFFAATQKSAHRNGQTESCHAWASVKKSCKILSRQKRNCAPGYFIYVRHSAVFAKRAAASWAFFNYVGRCFRAVWFLAQMARDIKNSQNCSC